METIKEFFGHLLVKTIALIVLVLLMTLITTCRQSFAPQTTPAPEVVTNTQVEDTSLWEKCCNWVYQNCGKPVVEIYDKITFPWKKAMSFVDRYWQNLQNNWAGLTCVFGFFLFIVPMVWPVFMYLLAILVCRAKPIRLGNLTANPDGLEFKGSGNSLDFILPPDAKLYLRDGDWAKMRTDCTARTKFLWSWRAPLVSLAADLCEAIAFRSADGKQGKVTITAPIPDLYVAQINLKDCPGLVVRPRYLVGVTDQIAITPSGTFIYTIFCPHGCAKSFYPAPARSLSPAAGA